MARVVVACRSNNKVEWEICYICQEADHAPYVAQEIKNQEGKSLIVGYCEEEDFFNSRLTKMKIVRDGGTLPAPASSIKKFKEYPLDYPKIKDPAPKQISTVSQTKPVDKVPEKLKDIEALPAKPTSELGMFR